MVRWLLVLAFLVGGCVAVSSAPRAAATDGFLAALDVGQGDSIVIDAGLAVMVDTGNPGQQALQKAQELGSRVTALVITHLHDDHAGDAVPVIRSGIAAVFWNGRTDGSLYAKIEETADAAGVPLVALVPGDVLQAGGARLSVLGPDAAYRTSGDPNDTSLVLRTDLPGFSALLTGDANLESETALPADALDADVLKVGHHGSKTSSGEDFLNLVSPEIALISSGKGNRYGHPTPEALERLENSGMEVYRTDEEGTIVVRGSNGTLRTTRR